MTQCSVTENDVPCPNNVLARGLCPTHYDRKRRTGSVYRIRKVNAGRSCDLADCDRQPVGNGLCRKHYQEQWRSVRRDERVAADDRTCENCGDSMRGKASGARFCSRGCKDQTRTSDGRARIAAAKSYFKQRYGLTVEQVEQMAAGGCRICGTTEWPGAHNRPHVDHDHRTGAVRGILCSECNTGLGKFRDQPDLLRKAATYLEASSTRSAQLD